MNLAKFYIYGGINENFLPQMSNFPTTFHAHIDLWVNKKIKYPCRRKYGRRNYRTQVISMLLLREDKKCNESRIQSVAPSIWRNAMKMLTMSK